MNRGFTSLFLADWVDVAFIHFRVDPVLLQPSVPFELDLFEGDAYVSIVSFTQRRLRPAYGGQLTELLSSPLSEHEFLNLRTYVKHDGDAGIYFLAEWIPNRLAQLVGPRLYGLPYHLGRLDYHSRYRRSVSSGGHGLLIDVAPRPTLYSPDARCNFLVERYSAYTYHNHVARRFDIAHDQWELADMDVRMERSDLFAAIAPWLVDATPVSAHYSAGVCDVKISAPRIVTLPGARARRSRCRLRRSGSVGCP